MRVAIHKMQQGGGAYIPPFVVAQIGAPVASERTMPVDDSSKKSKDSESSGNTKDITDPEILRTLDKMNGLPSDMMVLRAKLRNFIINRNVLSGVNPGAVDSSSVQLQYLDTLFDIKNLNFNKAEFDTAQSTVMGNGGINEVAVNERGQLFCYNKNKKDYQLLRPEELAKAKGYVPLTNDQLLSLRAQDPSLANNNELLAVVKNGVGIKTITDMIQGAMASLGSDTNTENGYISTKNGELIQGLESFKNAAKKAAEAGIYNADVNDLYKYQYMSASNANQAKAAMLYIYRTMPENMKSLLKYKSGKFNDAGAVSLIESLVASKVSNTSSFDTTIQNEKSNTSKDGSGADIGKQTLTPPMLLNLGFGDYQDYVIQNGTGTGLKVGAISVPIKTSSGQNMGTGTLNDIAKSQMGGYLDMDQVTMGGALIPMEGFSKVAVSGSNLYQLYLPLDQQKLQSGIKAPDIALINKVDEINKDLRRKYGNNITKEEMSKAYAAAGLPVLLQKDGTLNATQYALFGIVNGTALKSAFAENVDLAPYLKETEDKNTINGALDIMNQGRDKDHRIKQDDGWFSSDPMYQGTIFIAIHDNIFNAMMSSGTDTTVDKANLIEAKRQQAERTANVQLQGTLND